MKLVLIGFMGSGKTTVAKSLATKLNLQFIDMDNLVLKKTTRKSINQIFKLDGEKKFREIELEVAKEMDPKESSVISTGGGVVMSQQVMSHLTKNANVYYLKASFDKIKKRIALKEIKPPLFQNVYSAKKLFDLREPLYRQYANLVIETDHKNVEEIVKEIMEDLDGRK